MSILKPTDPSSAIKTLNGDSANTNSLINHALTVASNAYEKSESLDATVNGEKLKDPSGESIYQRDDDGNIIYNNDGTPVIKRDTSGLVTIVASKASVTQLEAESARIDTLEANSVTTETLNAEIARIDNLETNKANIDLANVNNAWIANGVIKDASIANEKVISVSANKLTAGTIDASKITVTNLNADNITVGTINGARIGNSSIDLDKLSQEVPTKEYLDSVEQKLQEEIDGAIETFTVSEIPTLNNEPAVNWTTDNIKSAHVGDLCYVVNSSSDNDGFCYRFQYNGTAYSWALIKDNDVTKAIQDIAELGGEVTQLKTDYTSKVSEIDGGIESLKSRTTTIETTYSTKTYTDNKASDALTSANSYADTKASSALTDAKSYTDNTASSTLGEAKSYTDTATADMATTGDIPTKVSELTNDSSFATTTQVSTAKSEAISTASADATSKANSALDSAKSYTDAIEIGGKNLLLNTADNTYYPAPSTDSIYDSNSTSGYPNQNIVCTADGVNKMAYRFSWLGGNTGSNLWKYLSVNLDYLIKHNKYLTFSVEIKTTGKLINPYIELSMRIDNNKTYNLFAVKRDGLDDGIWRRYEVTKDMSSALAETYNSILFVVGWDKSEEEGSTLEWRNLKLEIGNKATDWTPAPEDVDAGIANAQTSADSAASAAANAQTTADTAKTNAATAQSTADTAKANAATAQSTADTAKSNAAAAQTAASNAQTTANEAKAKAEAAQTAVSTKVETSVFNTLKNTVDENSANITSLAETVTTKADSSTVTTLSNTVNEVKQTADANSSSISSLTTTVNTKADGSKVTELETKTSTIEQNLNGIATRVTNVEKDMATEEFVTSQGYLTVTSDAITSKVSKNEVISAINQTAESVSIDASKINLNGAVTFTSFDSSLQTTINNKAETSDLEAVRTTADNAQDNALSAQEATDVLDDDFSNFKSNEYSQINDKVGELVDYKDSNERDIANIKSDLSNELVAKKFARIENGSLILGETGGTTAVLQNEQFGFYTPNSGVPASYFGKDGDDVWAFNIERGVITNDLRFGGFQWIARANKNMSLKWFK